MAREIAQYIPYLVGGLLALALILFIVALQLLRRGRTGPYWRMRRASGQRGGQLLIVSVVMFGAAIAIAIFSGLAALAVGGIGAFFNERGPGDLYGVAPTALTVVADADSSAATEESANPISITEAATPPTEAPTTTPSTTPTPTLTPTASATATLLPTNTRTATITHTPTETLTPSPTFEVALKLGIPYGARAAAENALVRIVAADTAVSGNNTPIEPREIFESGARRIYLFTSFRDMSNGVAWSRVLYRDGTPVQGSTLLWAMGAEGSGYFFFGAESGYAPGDYRIELWLGDQLVSEFEFVVIPSPDS
jgi:hypothetical protein